MSTPRKSAAQVARARGVLKALKRRYPDARCALDWRAPHELLIATILSAQTTDAAVNKATPALFSAFVDPKAFAKAEPGQIEPYLRTLNFWRMKAKAISQSMRSIVADHSSEVPRSMEALTRLRGVARKTANVLLGNAFGINEGIVVDTHVGRLAKRMGLSRHSDPVKVERDLMALFARDQWCILSHLLIAHGRAVCKARGAKCADDAICRKYCTNSRA